jgi:hypothetical protein
MSAEFPLANFNKGGRSLICMRAVPGSVSNTPMHNVPGPISKNERDSYFAVKDGVKTYVIRRNAQTLPCFVVYF